MRLGAREIEVVAAVLDARIRKRRAKLYLFGSRTQDQRKGGDIDLLVLALPAVIRDLRGEKHFLLAEVKKEIGDQRIDLVLAEASKARQDPFIRRALQTAILLKSWE